MRAADYIVDIGPGAETLAERLSADGTAEDIMACEASVTGAYLLWEEEDSCIPKEKKLTGFGD